MLLELGLRGRRELPARADVRAVALRGELGVERLAEAAGSHDAGLGREVAHHSQGLRATQKAVRLSGDLGAFCYDLQTLLISRTILMISSPWGHSAMCCTLLINDSYSLSARKV